MNFKMGFVGAITGGASKLSCIAKLLLLGVLFGSASFAQSPPQGTPPSADASCTVTALNRTAPVQPDYSFTIYNIPGAGTFIGAQGTAPLPPAPFRVRATCSDGIVGETDLIFPEFGSTAVYTGDIFWRPATPIPLAIAVTAGSNLLTTGQTTQLTTTGVLSNGQTADLSPRLRGTFYASSNPIIASVAADGLVTANALMSAGSSGNVVVLASNEGVAATTVLRIGPIGRLIGQVTRADGITVVSGAQVSVVRNQPREVVATIVTNSAGNYEVPSVGAGEYSIAVVDPATGDVGSGSATIEHSGDTVSANVRLNGQGAVTVTVVNASDSPVANASVTFASLSAFRETRTGGTNSSGQFSLSRVLAGPFSVSTRDPATGLVGTSLGNLAVGGASNITLKLQAAGAIAGRVFAADGVTLQEGTQVRLISAQRGLVSQSVTGADGQYKFDSLPLSDGPYIVDAFAGGRIRSRIPNLILTANGQELSQNVVFTAIGRVAGVVTRNGGPVSDATVAVQSQVGERYAFTTHTKNDGTYAIDGVPVGAFSISATSAAGDSANSGGNVSADGQIVTLNLQIATNGIVGTVFQSDNVTPAGAGVTVTLRPGGQTTTNALGQYGFTVMQPSRYEIEASDASGNRGISSIVLTTINPAIPAVVNVSFLGRGSVEGTVQDPSGAVQPGISVRLSSNAVFTGSQTTTADSQGRFRFNSVFVGPFNVYAQNTVTQLAGVASGQLSADGQTVRADVTLAASGTVTGRVLRNDGVTPAANARVEISANGLSTHTDANGQFTLPAVPLGEFTIVATNETNGDKGQVISRLSTLNEVKNVTIRFVGLGEVRVRAVDSTGAPMSGVTLTMNPQQPFSGSYRAMVTASDGTALFSNVFAGDFYFSGQKSTGNTSLSGSVSGTAIAGTTVDATLTMSGTAVFALTGVVTKAGVVQPGLQVRLTSISPSGGQTINTVTGADGSYRFDSVLSGGSLSLNTVSVLVNGRVRSQSSFSSPSPTTTTVVRDLALIGVGVVSGRVTNSQNVGSGGVRLTLIHPDPVYGGQWQQTTQADGTYRFIDIPAGVITVRAEAPDGKSQAQSNGNIRFDDDSVVIDLRLIESAITLPRTLFDANAAPFDLQRDGSIANGLGGAFNGDGQANTGANRLDIVVGGVPVPVTNTNSAIGALTQDDQLLEVSELHEASSLKVTRRIYVPKRGYFARYVEMLENPTANPITVGVRVSSNFSSGTGGARIVDSSNGDNVLNVLSNGSADRWAVVDDDRDQDPFLQPGVPATVLVFGGASANDNADTATTAVVGNATKTTLQWSDIVVPPGGTVALMHFTAQQLSRLSAHATAERLVELPPEALEGLSLTELNSIQNFRVPPDGLSQLQPLPVIDGTKITGTVLAGDGITPIKNSVVTYKSNSPFFGRTYTVQATSGSGVFTFLSRNLGTANVVAIPSTSFNVSATNPTTGDVSSPSTGQFVGQNLNATQDIVFVGTSILRGTVRRHTGDVVTSGQVYFQYPFTNGHSGYLYASISSTGGYEFIAITPRAYGLTAQQDHPQGQGVLGSLSVDLMANATTLADITLEATGEVQGTVLSADGQPAVGISVRLDSNYRLTQTDTGGRYRFTDVGAGGHQVTAFGANNVTASKSTSVSQDAISVVDLQLAGTGQLNVHLNYQRGAPAANVVVEIVGRTAAATNGAGVAVFTVPSDVNLIARAWHPDNFSVTVSIGARVVGNGGMADVVLTLPAFANIIGNVYRPDGVTPAGGVKVVLRRNGSSNSPLQVSTNADGSFRFTGLSLGAYTISAEDLANFKFADAEVALTADGEEPTVDLTLADNRIPLPAPLRDANDFQYEIGTNGAIVGKWYPAQYDNFYLFEGGANGGGSALRIDGELFTGEPSALLEEGRRQFAITQDTPLSNLRVTRKVFVPIGGYFARYLEILENPTSASVTASVSLRSTYYGYIPGTAAVVDTSSGDALLESSGPTRDTWAILDDNEDADPFLGYSKPPTLFVLGSAGTGFAPNGMTFTDFTYGNPQTKPTFEASWSQVTVPAGGRIILMHFDVMQVSRAGARAAAERLQQLPPEAIQALSAADRTAIVNFALPANGESALAPLPSLLGRVSGNVYEGDTTTPVPSTGVSVRSKHPLFSRTYMAWENVFYSGLCTQPQGTASLAADGAGRYSITGSISSTNSIAIPVDADVVISALGGCYRQAGHPITQVSSPEYTASLDAITQSSTQNIVFPTGFAIGRVIGPADYTVAGANVELRDVDNTFVARTNAGSDGSYQFVGLPALNYVATATFNHSQGSGLTASRSGVQVVVGQTTIADLVTQPTGSITGLVVTANGEASVGSTIYMSNETGAYVSRNTTSDSLGRFNLSAVPVGQYLLEVRDPRTGALTRVSNVVVVQNQVTTRNVTLLGTGIVNLTVNYARGTPAASTNVYLSSPAVNSYYMPAGHTDSQGKLSVFVPVGAFSLQVSHPQDPSYPPDTRQVSGTITANNETQSATLTLPVRTSVRITVVNGDAGNVPIPNSAIIMKSSASHYCDGCNFGSTDSSGRRVVANVREGSYVFEARTPQGKDAQVTGIADVSTDGQIVDKVISVSSAKDALGVLAYLDQRQLFTVPAAAGDVLDVIVSGASVNNGPSSYVTRVQVYGPTKLRQASGYAYDSRGSYAQYNDYRDLHAIAAGVGGNYTIAISPYYQNNASYLGGFRVTAKINGSTVNILPYQGGGSVSGTVLRSTSAPAAGQSVQLRTFDNLAMNVRTLTNAFGEYQFGNVPLGSVSAGAVDGDRTITSAGDVLAAEGDAKTLNLQLPVKTTLQIQATMLGGAAVPNSRTMGITLSDDAGYGNVGSVTFSSGFTSSDTLTVNAYGASSIVSAQHPNYPLSASEQVTGSEGQVVPVVLKFAVASLSGQVLRADGAPAIDHRVTVYRAADYAQVTSTYTDSTGHYEFQTVPALTDLIIAALDNDFYVETGTQASLQIAENAVRNLRLVGTGSVSGQVTRQSDGAPLVGVRMEVSYRNVDVGVGGYDITNYVNTDSDGRYTFENLPVGRNIKVTASVSNGAETMQATGNTSLSAAGQVGAVNLTLDVRGGSILARIVSAGDDNFLFGADCRVSVSRVDDGLSVDNFGSCSSGLSFYGLSAGNWRLDGYVVGEGYIPVGKSVVVTVTEGATVNATLYVPLIKSVVRLFNGDRVPNASVTYQGSTGYSSTGQTDSQGRVEFWGVVKEGPFSLFVYDEETGRSASFQGELVDVSVPLNVEIVLDANAEVTGTVKFASGAPVIEPEVSIELPSGDWIYPTSTDEQGNFTFSAVPVGHFTLHAQDPVSGLSRTAAGEVVTPGVPVVINVVLPGSNGLSGTFRTANGEPIANADVYVQSDGLDGFTINTTTDDTGSFTAPNVALGNISLSAYRWNDNQVAVAKGTLTSNGVPLVFDLVALETAKLSGQVFNADGSPALNAVVSSITSTVFGAVSSVSQAMEVDAQGRYEFAYVPVGSVKIGATIDEQSTGLSVIDLTQDTTVDITLGQSGVTWLPRTFSGTDASMFDFDCDGSILTGRVGGSEEAHDYSYYSKIGNDWFPCWYVAQVNATGRGLTFGPYNVSGLTATRKTYVPASGSYARYLETYVNSSGADITLPIQIEGWIRSDDYDISIAVDPSSTGGAYAVTSSDAGRPVLGHVFAGAGALVAATPNFVEDESAFSYKWQITVPAGGRVSLMHFAILGVPGDVAAVTARANAIATGSDPHMYDELSSEERSSIRNFVVP